VSVGVQAPTDFGSVKATEQPTLHESTLASR
jgi:hypothetical protein